MGIQVASAPVSWGIMENVEPPADYPYGRVLDEIASAGYSGTELGPFGYLPTDPSELRAALAGRNLQLCSAFIEMDLGNAAGLQGGLATVMRSAELIRAAGARLLILSDEITPARGQCAGRPEAGNALSWSEEEWSNAAHAVGEIVTRCRPLGLRVAFHHHAGTHVETPQEIDRLLALIPAGDLGLCLDTGHYEYGGGDVLSFVKREVSRIWCVHLKDINPAGLAQARRQKLDFHQAVRHGVFAPLGKGDIEFPSVLRILKESAFDGWAVVEADVLPGGVGTESGLANAIAARQYLRKHGL